jgi:leader peptidase (prepilin peptidase) / N-methyltransferase
VDPIYLQILIALFGLVIGSFLNVVIHRLPRDQSVVKPASRCPNCSRPIRWYENLPVLSYLLLRAKCPGCKTKISFRYPLVELLTAVLFFACFHGTFDIELFRNLFFIASGIAITFIDLDHRIIPDELSLGGWAVGLITAPWAAHHGFLELVVASLLGFGVFLGFAMLYEKLTGRVGIGGGDIKYMGTLGAFLGASGLWAAILVASVAGSVIGILYATLAKNEDGVMKASLPFGPFLVLGAFSEIFFGVSQWLILKP